MSLENLKIETDPTYDKEFFKYLPRKKNEQNNIDIYSIHDIVLKPNERKLIPLGFKVSIDENTIFMISHNEKTASLNGIVVVQKVIIHKDKDYIVIALWNTTTAPYVVKKGDIIAEGYLIASPHNYEIQRVKKV